MILDRYINSFKIRMILRTKKIQEYLNNICDIKSLLINLQSENRVSEKSEKLRFELLDKLPKVYSNFYIEFYKMKKRNIWVKTARIMNQWDIKYMMNLKSNNILNKNEIILKELNQNNLRKNFQVEKKIYRDTIDISDNEDLNENTNIKNKDIYFREYYMQMKDQPFRNENNKKDRIDGKNPFMSKEEYYSHFIGEKNTNDDITYFNAYDNKLENFYKNPNQKNKPTNNLNKDNINNYYENQNILIKEGSYLNNNDNIYHTNVIQNENFPNQNDLYSNNIQNNYQSNNEVKNIKIISRDLDKNDIDIAFMKSKKSLTNLYNQSKYSIENFYPINNQLNAKNKNNLFYNTHKENFLAPNFNNPHDEKPIKANPNIFNELLIDEKVESNKIHEEITYTKKDSNLDMNNNLENINNNDKLSNKDKRLKRKTPKYDAKKAIENAKSKDKKILENNFVIKKENVSDEINNESTKRVICDNKNDSNFDKISNNLCEKNKNSGNKEKELLERNNSPDFNINNLQQVKLPAYGNNSRTSQMRKFQNLNKTNDNDTSTNKDESFNNEKQIKMDNIVEPKLKKQDINISKAKSTKVIHSNMKSKNNAESRTNNLNDVKLDLTDEFRNMDNIKLNMKSTKSPRNNNKREIDDFNLNIGNNQLN